MSGASVGFLVTTLMDVEGPIYVDWGLIDEVTTNTGVADNNVFLVRLNVEVTAFFVMPDAVTFTGSADDAGGNAMETGRLIVDVTVSSTVLDLETEADIPDDMECNAVDSSARKVDVMSCFTRPDVVRVLCTAVEVVT